MRRALLAVSLSVIAGIARGAELELSYGRDALTGGRPGWSAVSLEASWRGPDRAALGLALRQLERFGARDVDLAAFAGAPLGARLALEAEASASPGHHFAPAWMGALRLSWVMSSGLVASSGARWSRYGDLALATTATVGTLGLERYWGSQRIGWTAYLAGAAGAWSGSQRVAWDVYYGERSRVGLGVAAGREVDSGAPPLVPMPVLGAYLAGRHELTEQWGVSYEAGVTRQGNLYTRAGARLGLLRTF